MFPWQSGSDGREETDQAYLNPRSGNFITDNTHLERHVGAAIAFNVWHYYEATGDADFLHDYGAELMLEIARFWAGIARLNAGRDRYEIRGVIGPDEFHDAYPGSAAPGLDNNAYTNIMAVWCIERALGLAAILPADRWRQLCDACELGKTELQHWDAVSRGMFVPFHEHGIISQFEGYEALEELDWTAYRGKYGDIARLDLILEAEGKSPNDDKLCKQADVLMLFYLFSTETLAELFARLDYPFAGSMIPKNIDYYLQRTSHGSTLSAVVDAWVLARSDRRHSWRQFKQALRCDVDGEGGMTAEGVHLGAMAESVDLLQRCYTGLELRDGQLRFNPCLPAELTRFSFHLRYRCHSLHVDVSDTLPSVSSDPSVADPITVRLGSQMFTIKPGERADFMIDPQPVI